jgi:hypothetical protein
VPKQRISQPDTKPLPPSRVARNEEKYQAIIKEAIPGKNKRVIPTRAGEVEAKNRPKPPMVNMAH